MGKVDGHTHLRQRHAIDHEETQSAELTEVIPESNIEIAVQHILQRCIEIWKSTTHLIAICIWVGGLYLTIATTIMALCALLCRCWVSGGTVLLIQGILILLPLGKTPAWGRKLLTFCIGKGIAYFPMRLLMENQGKAIMPGRPYVIGFEPHSALPFAMAGVFSDYSKMLPPALTGVKTLASSSLFLVPGLRHMWHWLGMRPVSRTVIEQLLSGGTSVCLCPGGVQECIYMVHGEEVAYLKSRSGFVRIAIQNGADLLPAFAFGQTRSYSWAKPGPPLISQALVAKISRMIGFMPLFMMGQCLSLGGVPIIPTPLPHIVPITVVLGAPIELPHEPQPSPEMVQHYLQQFIDNMTVLVQTHAAAAGYPDIPFTVY